MCITPYEEHKFTKFIENEYSFAICEKGNVMGVLMACQLPSVSMDAIFIDNFAVAEYARGGGAGKKLFKQLCRKMKEDGIRLVKLQTQRDREALEIYKHWGFEEVDMVQMERYIIG